MPSVPPETVTSVLEMETLTFETVTSWVAVAEFPQPSVTVTVYVVVEAGEAAGPDMLVALNPVAGAQLKINASPL